MRYESPHRARTRSTSASKRCFRFPDSTGSPARGRRSEGLRAIRSTCRNNYHRLPRLSGGKVFSSPWRRHRPALRVRHFGIQPGHDDEKHAEFVTASPEKCRGSRLLRAEGTTPTEIPPRLASHMWYLWPSTLTIPLRVTDSRRSYICRRGQPRCCAKAVAEAPTRCSRGLGQGDSESVVAGAAALGADF